VSLSLVRSFLYSSGSVVSMSSTILVISSFVMALFHAPLKKSYGVLFLVLKKGRIWFWLFNCFAISFFALADDCNIAAFSNTKR